MALLFSEWPWSNLKPVDSWSFSAHYVCSYDELNELNTISFWHSLFYFESHSFFFNGFQEPLPVPLDVSCAEFLHHFYLTEDNLSSHFHGLFSFSYNFHLNILLNFFKGALSGMFSPLGGLLSTACRPKQTVSSATPPSATALLPSLLLQLRGRELMLTSPLLSASENYVSAW